MDTEEIIKRFDKMFSEIHALKDDIRKLESEKEQLKQVVLEISATVERIQLMEVY